MLINIIATIVLIAILGAAIAYVVKAKKSGRKCIGCPDSKTCSQSSCGTCSSGCGGNTHNK